MCFIRNPRWFFLVAMVAALVGVVVIARHSQRLSVADLQRGMTRDQMAATTDGQLVVFKTSVFEHWGPARSWWNVVAQGDAVESYVYQRGTDITEVFFFRGSNKIGHVERRNC